MIKSLQEIEKDFLEQYQVEHQGKERPQKEHSKKEYPKNEATSNPSVVADIIFCLALIGMGLSAMLLSWNEQGEHSGWIYGFLSDNRGAILIGFLILIVISFVLRFFGDKRKEEPLT